MIIDYKKLEASPELIHVLEVDIILNCSRATTTRFINRHNVKRVMGGRRSYIEKQSLTRALQDVNAVSKELLEA